MNDNQFTISASAPIAKSPGILDEIRSLLIIILLPLLIIGLIIN